MVVRSTVSNQVLENWRDFSSIFIFPTYLSTNPTMMISLWSVCCLCCDECVSIACVALYVCLQSKVEGKTAAAAASTTTIATATSGERAATPTDKKDKPRSERKRVRNSINLHSFTADKWTSVSKCPVLVTYTVLYAMLY